MKISRAERRRRKFKMRMKHLDFIRFVMKGDPSDLTWGAPSRQSGDTHPLASDLEHCRYWAKCGEYKTKKRKYESNDLAVAS